MNIESKKYVATVSDIRKLAQENLSAGLDLAKTRGLYLQALVGTTQAELQPGASQEGQLKALKSVHRRFYLAVLETITTKDLANSPKLDAKERKRRSLARNKKSNFARSAYGTIRRWLKVAGHDMMTLKPAAVKKQQLISETPVAANKRKTTREKAQRRVGTLVDKILTQSRQLANVDPKEAQSVLDEVVRRMTQELFSAAAVSATKDPKLAATEGRPLQVGQIIYWPTGTPKQGGARKLKIAA